jgi:hypothetical protein
VCSRRKYAYISTKIEHVFGVSVAWATETPNATRDESVNFGNIGRPDLGVVPGNAHLKVTEKIQ